MRELINKLSKGIFEYESPIIETSVSIIELTLGTGSVYDGNIEIYSGNSSEIKGIAYSENDRFILVNNQFVGRHNVVRYKVVTEHMRIGDTIDGKIGFLCNGKEFEIPYVIHIDACGFNTAWGRVDNYTSFLNLVHNHYDEALAIFCSGEFEKILLSEKLGHLSLYEGLIKGNNKNIALEEFLIGIGKKKEVTISLGEVQKEFTNLESSFKDGVIVSKDHPGYVFLKIEVTGDFLQVEKKFISTEEFAGNHYELSYLIHHGKLHSGLNTARIRITSHKQTLDYCITVRQSHGDYSSKLAKKKKTIEFIRNYLDFRMQKIGKEDWIEKSLLIIESLQGIIEPLVLFLMQAQISVTAENDEETDKLLDQADALLNGQQRERIELYSFYLYIRALQKQDDHFTLQVCNEIKEFYQEEEKNSALFWILLNIDESLEADRCLKLSKIKEQYENSCKSPAIYFEAVNILNEFPEYLHTFDDFEIQVLHFAAKNNFIGTKLSEQVAEITVFKKDFHPLLFKTLKYLYDCYQDKQVLAAICGILIKGNRYGKEYFPWFALGVKAELKITKLYEYYIYSIDPSYTGLLPRNVLMYFIYNADSLQDKQAYLYYNIILNKEELGGSYRDYTKQIETYALSEFKRGNVNEFLAVLYKEVLNDSNMDNEILENLPRIFCTFKCTCKNRNLSRIIVYHDELKSGEGIKLVNGKAYLSLYTNNYQILFEDIDRNLYFKTIDYTLESLFDNEEKLEPYLKQNPVHELLAAGNISKILNSTVNQALVLDLLLNVIKNEDYRTEFVRVLLEEVTGYYSNHYHDEVLDEYLPLLDSEKMSQETRALLSELFIGRGMYGEAYSIFSRYGTLNGSAGKIAKFCSIFVEKKEFAFDEVILKLCIYAFKQGTYNEIILKYLAMHYNGTTKDLLDIWKALEGFECESRELEEKLLVQMIFTGAYPQMQTTIFKSYYRKGAGEEIRYAYCNYMAYKYYLKEEAVDGGFFELLEEELRKNFYMDELCKIAYLKYYSEAELLESSRRELCRRVMEDLVRRGFMPHFHKKFAIWFPIPYRLKDKVIVEYKARPGNKVMISYVLEAGGLDKRPYMVEEMQSIYPGIFIKEFIVFYGENLLYHITEETKEEELPAKSMKFTPDAPGLHGDKSRYGLLNDILLCMDKIHEDDLKELVLQYSTQKYLADNSFDIM